MFKIFFKIIFIIFSKMLIPIFYNSEYLRGKWFESSPVGWIWAWRGLVWQKIFGFNRSIPWPTSPRISVSDYKKIHFDINDLNNFQGFGNYFQCFNGDIYIGKGSYIAPNVGIITSNHDLNNLDNHLEGKDVVIGECCWIGMNSVILPGVTLGSRTIVGAGSVVTKCFPNGNCIIAGNPARLLKYF
ncbi:MAG: acyltransferase [Synergistales bacterium]